MADTTNVAAAQWVIMRRAGLHPDFESMTLLTKFEAYRERQELWAHKVTDELVQFFLVWRVEGHIIRFAQLMQFNSQVGALVTSFFAQFTPVITEMVNSLFKSEFNLNMTLIHIWTSVGNDYMPSYQNMAVDRWENEQLAKFSGNGNVYGTGNPLTQMLGWFFGEGEETDETIGTIPPKAQPPDEPETKLDDIWNVLGDDEDAETNS